MKRISLTHSDFLETLLDNCQIQTAIFLNFVCHYVLNQIINQMEYISTFQNKNNVFLMFVMNKKNFEYNFEIYLV